MSVGNKIMRDYVKNCRVTVLLLFLIFTLSPCFGVNKKGTENNASTIRIGASCVGRYFWFTDDCKVIEARILQNNEHPHFWEAVKHCLKNNIHVIVTIDTYLTGSRWNPGDDELTSFTDKLMKDLVSCGANKNNCTISYDNEPEEHIKDQPVEKYVHRLKLIHDRLNGKFDLIAGNVCSDLGFLDYVCQHGRFEILGVHFQSGAETPERIEYYGNKYEQLAKRYNKRITCTEANWFDVSTSNGYKMLLRQLNKAEQIGCEDFCVVVINQTFGYEHSKEDRYVWLAFLTNGVPRSPYWSDFVSVINEKSPKKKR